MRELLFSVSKLRFHGSLPLAGAVGFEQQAPNLVSDVIGEFARPRASISRIPETPNNGGPSGITLKPQFHSSFGLVQVWGCDSLVEKF